MNVVSTGTGTLCGNVCMDDIEYLLSVANGFDYPPTVKRVFSDIPGPAFFPGGTGVVQSERSGRHIPRRGALILGHNFGNVACYETGKVRGDEYWTNPTWKMLRKLLVACEMPVSECFFTNALMGVMVKDRMCGTVAGFRDKEFLEGCRQVLGATLQLQKPRLVLILGRPAINFLAETFSEIHDWKRAVNFSSLDEIGPVRAVSPESSFGIGVTPFVAVALTHPCLSSSNDRHRKFAGLVGGPAEREMVKSAISITTLQA